MGFCANLGLGGLAGIVIGFGAISTTEVAISAAALAFIAGGDEDEEGTMPPSKFSEKLREFFKRRMPMHFPRDNDL